MSRWFFIIIVSFNWNTSFSQEKLPTLTYTLGSVEYERIFLIDSSNSKEQLFNAVKQALIRNTNYKFEKIDEDRTAGNITTVIKYSFYAKPGIAKVQWLCSSLLSIDVRDKKFRVRISNIQHSTPILNTPISATLTDMVAIEEGQLKKGRWKSSKSMVIPWNNTIHKLIEAFGNLIILESLDDF